MSLKIWLKMYFILFVVDEKLGRSGELKTGGRVVNQPKKR
jgi:hypothetical protein